MSTSFTPMNLPFPMWLGPYSPRRGTYSGWRVNGGRLVATVYSRGRQENWQAVEDDGIKALCRHVSWHFGGGRVLILPSGHVVKPDQEGWRQRYVIGSLCGIPRLHNASGGVFDMSGPKGISPGQMWPGPASTGIECVIRTKGQMTSNRVFDLGNGEEEEALQVVSSACHIWRAFREVRHANGGRVRVTCLGVILTNHNHGSRHRPDWSTHYLGTIDLDDWRHHNEWVGTG